MLNVSATSLIVSSTNKTLIVLAVSPDANLSVPEAAT